MAEIDVAQFKGSLTAEQQPLFDNLLTHVKETAVTEFKTEQQKQIPEKYDLTPTQESPLDPQADVEKIAAFARQHGFSNEQAAALLKHHEETAGGLVARQQAQLESQKTAWLESLNTDKELGGEHLEATLLNTKRAMDKFAPEGSAFRKFLNDSGYGNHPEWVRFVNAIGRAMAEDTGLHRTSVDGGRIPTAEVLYGKN